MAITGPKIQPPNWNATFVSSSGTLQTQSVVFLHSVEQTVFNISRSGPTGSRPKDSLDGRFIGMPFFDTTLGKPIWLKVAGTTNAWVLADGTPA